MAAPTLNLAVCDALLAAQVTVQKQALEEQMGLRQVAPRGDLWSILCRQFPSSSTGAVSASQRGDGVLAEIRIAAAKAAEAAAAASTSERPWEQHGTLPYFSGWSEAMDAGRAMAEEWRSKEGFGSAPFSPSSRGTLPSSPSTNHTSKKLMAPPPCRGVKRSVSDDHVTAQFSPTMKRRSSFYNERKLLAEMDAMRGTSPSTPLQATLDFPDLSPTSSKMSPPHAGDSSRLARPRSLGNEEGSSTRTLSENNVTACCMLMCEHFGRRCSNIPSMKFPQNTPLPMLLMPYPESPSSMPPGRSGSRSSRHSDKDMSKFGSLRSREHLSIDVGRIRVKRKDFKDVALKEDKHGESRKSPKPYAGRISRSSGRLDLELRL